MGSVTAMADDGSAEPRDPDLMTLSQAATFLRVRPTDLMTAIRDGEVPFYRQRGRLWFSRSELVERLRRGAGPLSREER